MEYNLYKQTIKSCMVLEWRRSHVVQVKIHRRKRTNRQKKIDEERYRAELEAITKGRKITAKDDSKIDDIYIRFGCETRLDAIRIFMKMYPKKRKRRKKRVMEFPNGIKN